jgi:threonine dehydratase
MNLSLQRIYQARKNLEGIALAVPLTFSHGLSEVSGAKIYLKWENLQRTGSFKLRGAVHKMRSLTRDELSRGVTAASTGNHAQGVAYGAKLLGIPATVVMPRSANRVKVENTERLGAKVILRGETYEEAYSHCTEFTTWSGMTYIPAFEDVDVMAGQGTIALEILESLPETDMILVPVGGGGLISGIAVGAKGINPKIEVIGVQSTQACTMFHCFKMGRMVSVPVLPTLADGLAGGIDEVTLKIVHEHVDEIVRADEDRLLETIRWVLSHERQVVEASGVVGVTAIQQGRVPRIEEKNVVVVISGGNIDVSLLDQAVLSDVGDSDGTVDK